MNISWNAILAISQNTKVLVSRLRVNSNFTTTAGLLQTGTLFRYQLLFLLNSAFRQWLHSVILGGML